MLVRPDLAGLTDSEIKGHEQIMRTAEKTWDQVRLTTPASFALALLAADKATVAHDAAEAELVTARHDPSVSTRRLATLALACDEARAARRTAKKVLERKYGDHMLAIGHKKLERFSTAIQERLEEPDQVTAWAVREHDKALALRPDTSPDDVAAYLNCLERARIGHALARYFVALAAEAEDFLRLQVQATEQGPGTRALERGSALGGIRERSNEDLVEDAEGDREVRRRGERDGRERARARARVTGARRPQSRAQAENDKCGVQ